MEIQSVKTYCPASKGLEIQADLMGLSSAVETWSTS